MRIEIPEFALVALIGASSSGKTTFAKKYFLDTEILSSDFFRGIVCDDQNNQKATSDAFDLLYYAADKRLSRMKTTVIDATNLQPSAREHIISLAKKQNVHSVAIVLNMPEDILLERNSQRADRKLSEKVIKKHISDLHRSIKRLKREGFRFIYIINSPEEANNIEIIRTKLWNNQRDEHSPLDIIGDVHGCYDELISLLNQLGYRLNDKNIMTHPNHRKAVFVGDLCDRGEKNKDVLKLVMSMVKSGNAYAVAGNHDVKLLKYLNGKTVNITHGLEKTVSELNSETETFKEEVKNFLNSLVSHYVFDNGKIAVSHAGLKEEYIGRGSKRVREFCLYGETTGENDEYGLPVRIDWAADYRGNTTIVYGHTPQKEVYAINNTFCIDTGCVFGGKLTAFRYPEKETVSVPALQEYYSSPKRTTPTEQAVHDDMLSISDVQGKLYLNTALMPTIIIEENNTAAALEIMSRFAADPHWLIYLPPTMSPCKTSKLENYLEYPSEAFEYYKNKGIKNIICEKKHMGSRAVIVLCRNPETAQKRFGITDGTQGIIYTRTGRHFFENHAMEQEILSRLNKVLTETGFWQDLKTDWICLDTELMPWSEKAQSLLKQQYAPVGRAGKNALSSAVNALEMVCQRENQAFEVDSITSGQNIEPKLLLERFKEKQYAIEQYTNAYREYCWKVNNINDLKIAPFHLLACENMVFSQEKHTWHMETLKKYCTGIDPIFITTDYICVDTSNEDSIQQGIEWWLQLTGNGGEGMVVKPETFIAKDGGQVIQPAIKCRGKEYLRIIYGPEYLLPEHLQRLKSRSLAGKRALALREFSLGMESLERFVKNEPLYKVHECVFGILALESEPVDPRL